MQLSVADHLCGKRVLSGVFSPVSLSVDNLVLSYLESQSSARVGRKP